ncbi:TcdA/TcdB pore-forming domain-containing protein [Pseudomonas sp. D3-10]|uniref:TcdA/TcdB pore-forming domain-containing protein n=1 Tax=Pseudomonas sp. D3-10 TaxID=2817392 RepID=UPI003DA98E91
MKRFKDSPVRDYATFDKLVARDALERILTPYTGTEGYDAALRYYDSCVKTRDTPEMLTPLAFLKRTLESLQGQSRRRRASESSSDPASEDRGLRRSHRRVESYETRLSNRIELMKQPVSEVPRKLHFVWLGGGLGDIQLDYLRLWKQVMPKDFTVNVWHDPDGLLVHETTRIIVEAAKADTWGGEEQVATSGHELADRYEVRVTALKRQMSRHIDRAVQQGKNADEARIDLLVRGYERDESVLRALKNKNAKVMHGLSDEGVQLRSVRELQAFPRLGDFYHREMSLRGNLAAASDIVRMLVVHDEGGIYSDVDFLPPFVQSMAGIDVSRLKRAERLGVLQLLLNKNPGWMPGRQALVDRYTDYTADIPEEHRGALEQFAETAPSSKEVFAPFTDGRARADSLRLAQIDDGESNALIVSHPGSAAVNAIIERFEIHHQALLAVEREAGKDNINFHEADRISNLAEGVLKVEFDIVDEKTGIEDRRAMRLRVAIMDYFSDGLRPQAEGSIFLTGPGAVRAGLMEYGSRFLTPQGAEALRKSVRLNTGFNNMTEEEQDHSWKENAADMDAWFAAEKARWTEGRMQARYTANLAELLKPYSIEFEEGWPVIEGRHVLSTDVLQPLADELGEPFIAAMSQGHTGEVVFDEVIPLGFDDRQSIRAQSNGKLMPAPPREQRVQPLSIGQLLNEMAGGHLDVLQLGPLQRLQIGALIGLKRLDNASFDAARPQLENLLNDFKKPGTLNRYTAIERALYAHQAPAFLAGIESAVNGGPRHDETALGLRRSLLEKPLTLRQWGQYVERVQQAAMHEYRSQIVRRLNTVLFAVDPNAFRSVPQDLLFQGPGDRVAGRCYPLSLAMAAAFSQGADAIRTLCNRFELAIAASDEGDSPDFMSSLESLREMKVDNVGNALERADLGEVVHILQNKTASTLMLNSDNHVMLAAKTIEGGHETYHFYDPNFGVFGYEDATGFTKALEEFFITQGMAAQYGAYGEETHPSFDLIELDGSRVAKEVLPNTVRVSQLLLPDALRGQSQRSVRTRIASARGQSLQDNPRLGSCLLALDGHWWAQQIADATTRLQQTSESASSLVPLFDTLEGDPDGTYRITMVDPADPGHPVQIKTDDHRLLRIKNHLSERFSTLANQPTATDDAHAVGGVHTLNAGFAIQALMNALRGREGADRPLTLAVRLHAYVNYAQMAHGTVADVAGLVGLVRKALDEEKLIASTVAPVVKASVGATMSEATGGLLQLANVGFDIYQLATAHNDVERAQFGTQLAFDSGGLALSAGALMAGATTGAFLGSASVLLAGLGVGVAALAQGFANIAEEAKQVGLFFDEVAKAHLNAYRLDAAHGAWKPRPSLIIDAVNLADGTLNLGSPKLYPLYDHFGVPSFSTDRGQPIDIRGELDLPSRVSFTPPAGQAIVLPCIPQTCYRYEYKALPFANWRHDTGFDTARRLEKRKANGEWLFLFSFYSFPSDYILHRLFEPDYSSTTIDVVLDDTDRSLVIPELPPIWHKLITYRIQGAGKRCAVLINPGVKLALGTTQSGHSTWILDAPWAEESDIKFPSTERLSIGDVEVTFTATGSHEVLLRTAQGKVFQVDRGSRQLNVVLEVVPECQGQQALQEYFKALNQQHRLTAPYTPVRQYLIPFEDPKPPRHVTAWYDSKEDRFLYIRDEIIGDEPTSLGAVVNGYAWFYDTKDVRIWQVDAKTGLLSRHYWLWGSISVKAVIKSVEADAQGIIHIVQQITRKDRSIDVLAYVIQDERLLLTSITRGLDPHLEALLGSSETLRDWSLVLADGFEYSSTFGGMHTFETVTWQPAPFVSICWKLNDADRDMAWVRWGDNLIIRPVPPPKHYRSWPDTIKDGTELTLLSLADEIDAFMIFDRKYRTVCRRQRTLVDGKAVWSDKWRQRGFVEDFVAMDNGYAAMRTDGLFFNLTRQGDLRFGGINEHWFKAPPQKQQHWWPALESLARKQNTDRFDLLGLVAPDGKTRLYAWYIDNRLLLAKPEHATVLRLLNVTPDGEAAWLFDMSNGEVLRQALIDHEQVERAFGQGSQLLQADVLAPAKREWAPWKFVNLTVDGPGLRGVTEEGLVIMLRDPGHALLTGVTREWVVTQGGREQEALERLARSVAHSALLTVEVPDGLAWFVADTGRMIRVPRVAFAQGFEVLGTQHQTNVLLRENKDGKLLTYPREGDAGPLSYVQREGEVLVVQSAETKIDDLPALLPDDVTTLVLRMGEGAVTYRLPPSIWWQVQSVILDCRPSLPDKATVPGTLVWDLKEPEQLQLSIVDEHLVIFDPNSGRSVICREVFATDVSLRGNVRFSFGGARYYSVSTWVTQVVALSGSQSITLKELLETSAAREVDLAG